MRRDALYCSYDCRMRAYQVRLRSRAGYLKRFEALQRKLRTRDAFREMRRLAEDPEYAEASRLAALARGRAALLAEREASDG